MMGILVIKMIIVMSMIIQKDNGGGENVDDVNNDRL